MNEKILVVDDEENIRYLYEQELIEEGYQTVLAKDDKECLEKVRTESPDLIILDMRMSRMDGLEAIGWIIELNKNLPVIINTGYPSVKENYISWSADAYIQKSSNLNILKTAIKEVFEKRASNEKTNHNDRSQALKTCIGFSNKVLTEKAKEKRPPKSYCLGGLYGVRRCRSFIGLLK